MSDTMPNSVTYPTNRVFYKETPLQEVLTAYDCDRTKGFNKGLEEWLSFPHFIPSFTHQKGSLWMIGKRHKGHLYTPDEFAAYKMEGMLP